MKQTVVGITLLLAGLCGACQQQTNQPETLTFQPLESGVSFTCRALSVPDDQTIWASGSHHTVLRSVDGGRHWTACSLPKDSVELDFRSLYAWNADSAIVVSTTCPTVCYKTTDGGTTWKQIFATNDPAVFVNSMDFKDGRDGVIVGDAVEGHFYLLRSQDRGESWQPAVAPEALPGQGSFAASNTCIQYLPSGKILFGTGVTGSSVFVGSDQSATWQSVESQIVQSTGGTDGIYTLCMLNDQIGWVGGGNFQFVERCTHVASYTTDGGLTWTPAAGRPHGFISGIAPFPQRPEILLAVGSDGCSVSEDQGKSWENQTDQLPAGVKGYHVAKASRRGSAVYVAGDKGQLAKVTWN